MELYKLKSYIVNNVKSKGGMKNGTTQNNRNMRDMQRPNIRNPALQKNTAAR